MFNLQESTLPSPAELILREELGTIVSPPSSPVTSITGCAGEYHERRGADQANSLARCVAARTASMQAERKARSSRAASPAMVVPPGLVT